MFGRRRIYCNYNEICADNVAEIYREALLAHRQNVTEMDYLHEYRRGKAPVLDRKKEVRSDIVNKITDPMANQIVSFKVGYQYGEPLVYVSGNDDKGKIEVIKEFNRLMRIQRKHSKDIERAQWFFEVGMSYFLVLPNRNNRCGFDIFVPDPRKHFIIYRNDYTQAPMADVAIETRCSGDGITEEIAVITTETHRYEVDALGKVSARKIAKGMGLNLIEYSPFTRMGAFEGVISILDAVDNLQSNRLDDVEQFVQAYMKFIGCDMNESDLEKWKELHAIFLPEGADVQNMVSTLNQSGLQTFKKDLTDTVIERTSMPNRNGGSSTSDTSAAVIFRDGWTAAESEARTTDETCDDAEARLINKCIWYATIFDKLKGEDLSADDIVIKHPRKNQSNQLTGVQALCEMLNNPKIHPLVAYQTAGMMPDPLSAYEMGMDWYGHISKAEEGDGRAEGDTVLGNDE